ncbi:MAG: UDP-N-acetylmuramate--L-alanine ligase [Saprospiraceae bacterium]
MTSLQQYKQIYFLGIGGIGMSAIARYFSALGKKVAGYDKTETELTKKLVDEGMSVHYRDDINLVPKDTDLVIYTPAIPNDNTIYNYLIKSGLPMMKRAQALGLISIGSRSICIAGTHGKTTTSTWTTHVLKTGGLHISAFLGGVSVDYQSNNIIGTGDIVVLEADEYDRSFLHLRPWIASVSSMDADHLDIYGDANNMKTGFKQFIELISQNGFLIIKKELLSNLTEPDFTSLKDKNIQILDFGTEDATILISNLRVNDGKFIFDYSGLGHELKDITSSMPGLHNVENASVAITCGLICHVDDTAIRNAIGNFKGIQRRFEFIINNGSTVFIDDYAHHPSELNSAINAARKLYPNRKITGIFQPHLYTRTRDFVDGFAESLDMLDEIILMDIYPARELPIEGVTSEIIFKRMKNPNKILTSKTNLMKDIQEKKFDVLMTLGAGDIDTFVPKIKQILS